MTTLWRIVFLFFLSFFRNKFSLIETSTFSSSLISNETSFIKNSISMKVKIIHTAFIHSFHCVLSFTFPCIIRYRIYFSRRAKRNEIPFKFCGRKIEIYINFPPLLEPFISIPVDSRKQLTSFERDVLPRRGLFLLFLRMKSFREI